MRNRKPLIAVTLAITALLSSGCATPAGGCGEPATREHVLLQTPARGGRLLNSDRESLAWRGNGALLLTPTTLYLHCSGGDHAISYATITDVTVRDVSDSFPLLKDKVFAGLLVIQTSRPTCWRGCVYDFGDVAVAQRAAEIIAAQRPLVDPFGRRDGARKSWLAAGLRNAVAYWAVAPAYLEKNARDQRAAIDAWFCARMNCKSGGNTAALFGPALRQKLPDESPDEYMFLELPGVEVNHRTELAVGALVKTLKSVDPEIDRLLVSGLQSVAMVEKISADYRVSIEVTFRAFVDYFDLDPIKDGHYFFESHVVTRPLDEWLAMDQAGFDAEVTALAGRVAARIRKDIGLTRDPFPGDSPGEISQR